MKLVQGVLRSLAAGISPGYHRFSIARTLATNNASVTDSSADANSPETMEDIERSIYGDPTINNMSTNDFFQKLDRPTKAFERYKINAGLNSYQRSENLDGLDDGFSSMNDGVQDKLKEAATYFEYDANEAQNEDYKFRSDVTFWPGNTYDVKDLDPTKPGARKGAQRPEFKVTTAEALQKADFRNVRFLSKFLTEAGIIVKRSKTKISRKAQRKISREIKTARAFGLLPFTTMGTKHFVYGRTMQELDKDYEYDVYDQNSGDEAS